MIADRVGPSIHRSRRLSGSVVGVEPYFAEVITKSRLHECARCGGERLSRRAQDVMHDRRHAVRLRVTRGAAMQDTFFLLSARITIRARSFAGAFAVQQGNG